MATRILDRTNMLSVQNEVGPILIKPGTPNQSERNSSGLIIPTALLTRPGPAGIIIIREVLQVAPAYRRRRTLAPRAMWHFHLSAFTGALPRQLTLVHGTVRAYKIFVLI